MSYLYDRYPRLFGERTTYVATGIVFNRDYSKVLLCYHDTQKMWISPGGHVKRNIFLHDEVVKLIAKESGYKVDFVSFHESKAFDDICIVVPQPFRVQVEKQVPNEGHDTHYDFLYIFVTNENTLQGSGTLKHIWVSIDEISKMAKRRETYQDVSDITRAALAIVNERERELDCK